MSRGRKVIRAATKSAKQVVSAVQKTVMSGAAALGGKKKMTSNVPANAQKLSTAVQPQRTTLGQKPPMFGSQQQSLIATSATGIEEKARTRKTILGAGIA